MYCAAATSQRHVVRVPYASNRSYYREERFFDHEAFDYALICARESAQLRAALEPRRPDPTPDCGSGALVASFFRPVARSRPPSRFAFYQGAF